MVELKSNFIIQLQNLPFVKVILWKYLDYKKNKTATAEDIVKTTNVTNNLHTGSYSTMLQHVSVKTSFNGYKLLFLSII